MSSQEVDSNTDHVQQYLRDAEVLGIGVEERSPLAQLCSECILLFQIILKVLGANYDSQSKGWTIMKISLERSYGRLKIWSEDHGAADGSLDATLAASRDLQCDTRKYIVSISQTLTERLISSVDISLGEAGKKSISVLRSLTAAVTEGESDNSSDSGFSDSSTDSISEILEDLRVDTTCLLDLEPLLSSPILRTDIEPAAVIDTTRLTWTPHRPYSDKVSLRFPMAADDLVNRLGKANYKRYLRCQEQKTLNELGDIPPDQGASGALESASSKFHDSGIGSSLPTAASSYAETAMSYSMGEGQRVRVPPLPAQAKEGLPFACMACGMWVKIQTNSDWKKHIYRDLEPWICLEAQCVSGIDSFPTRNDWIYHLALHHRMEPEWRMVECPLCRVEIGPGKVSITKHMSDHLEEISLAALPADCEPDQEIDNVSIGDPVDDLPSTTSIEVEPDQETLEAFIPDALECPTCHWRPDPTGRRSTKKLKLAVQQHFKRNHQSRDYSCPVCHQSFRNRPDNVKPHVARKHPEYLARLYPKKAPRDDQDEQQDEQQEAPPKTTMKSKAISLARNLKLLP